MGGKPQKPKIQADVDQQWFDEFENYRQQHSLNQSKTLEKILSQFFGSEPSTYTAIAPDFTTALEELQEEIQQKFSNLSQRLLVIESRLAIESANESAKTLTESVVALSRLANESASEAASESASESATGSDGLANESALPPSESAVVPNGLAPESADESASVGEGIVPTFITDEAIAAPKPAIHQDATPATITAPQPEPTKRGRPQAKEVRKLIESCLPQGKIIGAKQLAELAGVSQQGLNLRKNNGSLWKWGVEAIAGTRPQKYRRV